MTFQGKQGFKGALPKSVSRGASKGGLSPVAAKRGVKATKPPKSFSERSARLGGR
jgi:hypothetical protein